MLQNISIFNTIFNDAPQPWQLGFQDSAAPGLTGIVELHNTIFFLFNSYSSRCILGFRFNYLLL